MLPRAEAPARRLPYTTADMSERLAKKKAEQDAAEQVKANQALRFGVTNPPAVKKDEGGGGGLWPSWKEIGNAAKIGLGGVAGMANTVVATPLDATDWAVQQLDKYVGGVKPQDQFDPASIGSYNLLGTSYRGVNDAAQYTAGTVAAIPGAGKPSASPFMNTVRQSGWANAIAEPLVHAGNVAAVAYPAAQLAVGTKLPETIANAYRQQMLERDIAAQNKLFPAVQRPANVIDVVEGSRLPSRVVDSPATPATRLAEAQAVRELPPVTQRALPPATTADMAEQLARAQARQQTHFGTVSKEPIDVIQSTEFPRLSSKYVDEGGIPDPTAETRQAMSFPVYEIGGQKIAFGNPDLGRFAPEFNAKDVQFVPLDPYQITGLPKTSVEGQNFATTMFDAHQGMQFESPGTKNIGQVSALTYAASRGDNIAMQELQRLANVGKQGMNAARLAESERILSFHKDWSDPKFWDNKPTVQVKLGTAKDGYTEIKRPMGIDDMFLVHQTDYAPTFDANGNIILKPTGDYAPIDPTTGKPMIDKVSGKPVENYDRDNVHFTINHLVEGHMWRNSPTGQSHVILVPLRDVLDANPGSLDNLYAIDTFLTPKPGEGLVIPMQNGRIVQGVGEETSKNVFQALQEIGKLHNQNPEYQTKTISGGQHYANTEHIDDRIRQVALQELEKEYPEYVGGVSGVTHANHPSYFAQRFDNSDLQGGRGWLTGQDYWRMSPNQKLRIYDSNTNKYTTGELKTTYEPDYFGL
jgi:hypothetical protein